MKRDYDEVLSEYGVATYNECISNNKPATTDREEFESAFKGYNLVRSKSDSSKYGDKVSQRMWEAYQEGFKAAKAQAVQEDNKDLLQSLRDMVEIVGANFCSNQDVKRKYKIARELLEQNK